MHLLANKHHCHFRMLFQTELGEWLYDFVWFYVNCIGQGLLYSFRIDYLNSFQALVFSASLWLSIVYFPNWNVHLVHNNASLFHFICICIFLFYFTSRSLFLCLSLCVFFFSFSSHNVSTVFWNPWVVQSIDKIAQIKQRPNKCKTKHERARSNLTKIGTKKTERETERERIIWHVNVCERVRMRGRAFATARDHCNEQRK